MTTLTSVPNAKKVWFDDVNFWVLLDDGRQLGVPLSYSPRLFHATREELLQVELLGGGQGLHWESLDEDLSIEGILMGNPVAAPHR